MADDPTPSEPSGNPTIGRDQVSVKDSPGAITGQVGSLSQNYGQQHTINTAGGTYYEIHYHGVVPPLSPLDPAALQAAYDHLAALPLDQVPSVGVLPPGSRIPLGYNPLFVGRKTELQSLAATLKAGGAAAIAPLAAATGLGGIGKTQLAAEVAHRYGQYFAGGVFWMSFASADSVPSEIAACGGSGGLNLPGFDRFTLNDQVAAVIQAWHSPLPRLLVFDNCEDEALLDRWRPKSGSCRILITSRRGQWDVSLGVATLTLDTLPRPQSIALLRKFRPDLPETDTDLHAIAAELGDLPLALHLAGNYLKRYQHALTPAAYLVQVRDPALLQHRSLHGAGISPTGHDLDVGRTFALSYDQLDIADPIDILAMQLLARAAYFAPGEPIPRDLLAATVEIEGNDAPLQVEDAIIRLIALGLLESAAAGALRLHRLLGMFVAVLATDGIAQAAVEQTMQETAGRLNAAGYPAPLVVLQLHLRLITDRAVARSSVQAALLCNRFGYHLSMIGSYSGARPYYEQALVIDRAVLGENHADTAGALNNLGALLYSQGDLVFARSYYEQALAIYRTVLGENHADTARSLNNLGVLLQTQGDLAGARSHYEQALVIDRAVLGENHADTALSLNNLGMVLQTQGDLAGARPYLEQALAIYRTVLGENHPSTAISLNNLGVLLQTQGDLAGARSYYEQALAINRTTLGENHADTARNLNNLGMLLSDQGDLAGARPYYEQALAINRTTLGENHPSTAMSLNNLGVLLQRQGDLAGARPYLEQALVIDRAVLGENHADTAGALNNLGVLLSDQGDLVGARSYYEQALAIYRTVLGENHADTALSLSNLGTLLYKQGDLQGAQAYLEQALAILEHTLGPDHPRTRNARNNLEILFADLDRSGTA